MTRAAVLIAATGLLLSLAACRPHSASKPTIETMTASTNATPAHTNHLATEKSPYLLQHQHNPVDWYPWGEEAFARARKENKPIFLSIGYSTCHWCHVMERESFENEDTAKILNANFISIKVDREERPDVDKIYMTFIQSTTGSGGWPLNVFITPNLKPFFGGTYFPPENRYGRGSFPDVLKQVANLWKEKHEGVASSADSIHSQMEATAATNQVSGALPGPEALRRAGNLLKESFDSRHGGFGGAPKFPQPSQPQLALRYAKRFSDAEAIGMVLTTCDRMAKGGIHDQLGGGFARYSVDAEWLVPHFEKMLYDNAQLAQLYLDAFLVSGAERHAVVARDILDYVLRDMTHPDGGFYSAEDADSEGHEGKFYCWTREELSRLLTPEEFNVTTRYYGITEEGNFVDHSHPQPLLKQNVLSIVAPELPAGDLPLLASARKKMSATRATRIRPHLDDKILASWNGLMAGAFARAGVVLNEPRYLAAAEKNSTFIQRHLWDQKNKTLFLRWRDGERNQVELLEGYAFYLSGMIDLYEATLQPRHLEFCVALAETMIQRFYDAKVGAFWQSSPNAKDLILKVKEDYDGAEPSGNSVATLALLRLGKITGETRFTAAAEKTLGYFSGRMQQFPQAIPYMMQALDFALEEPRRAVVAGDPTDPAARELLLAIHAVYQPNKVVLGTQGPVEEFARTLPAKNGAQLYLCTGQACQAPTADAARVKKLMGGYRP
jgi:uncharacterized protein YyaL (SSP411 family)